MSFQHEYPYGDIHELNLDWVIQTMQDFINSERAAGNTPTVASVRSYFTHKYPYGDIHELNLDWVIQTALRMEEIGDRVEGDIGELQTRMTAAEANILALDNTVDGLNDSINQIETEIENINDDVEELQTAVAQHTTQIEDLDDKIDTQVVANPAGTATDTLNTIEIAGTAYEIQGSGGGSEVEPNPAGEPTDTLDTIGIDGTVYEVGGSEPVSKTVTGNPISITDAADAPIVSGEVTFEPVQAGSGIPSPENIRPITGYDDCEVEVTDDATSPTVTNTYTIDLDGTRYGGTEDLITGKMLVNMIGVDLGDFTWEMRSDSVGNYFRATLYPGAKQKTESELGNVLCSIYPTSSSSAVIDKSLAVGSYGNVVYIRDTDYPDASTFKTAMSGAQLVYELATPFTVQLTPEQIRTLEGTNNISTNMTSMSLEYITQDYQPLVKLIERSAGHHYSTQERVIGTWIDGKPLYEKVFSVTLPTFEYNQWTIIDSAELSNVSEMTECLALKNTSTQSELPSTFSVIGSLNNNNKIQIMNLRNADYGSNIPARVIVHYAKTTD